MRYLVEAHGGTIAADSPGEGQGATFCVQLPLLPADFSEPITVSSSQTPSLAGLRIMAIDDEADARTILEAILEFHGAEVFGARQQHGVFVLNYRSFAPKFSFVTWECPEWMATA